MVTGLVKTFTVPAHPVLGSKPGGPVPYELRLAPDGKVWMSELQGNRIVCLEPETGRFEAYPLPTSFSGPRRFDIDGAGTLWIPAYAAGLLVRFDPRTKSFREIPLPVPDALPYIVRLDHSTGHLWIGTAACDVVFRYDPRTETFASVPLPTRGVTVRHLVVDDRSHDVWLAYGASPAIHPARVARIRVN
jgi:streptogramin lyase